VCRPRPRLMSTDLVNHGRSSAHFAAPPQGGSEGWVCAQERTVRELSAWLLGLPARLVGARDLLLTSVVRDLQVRFRGSRCGVLWIFAQPLALFAIYGFVFTRLLGVRMPGAATGGGGAAFGMYLFLGTLVWSSLADTLTRCTTCLVDQRNLVQKHAFPVEILPLTCVLSNAVVFWIALLSTWIVGQCCGVLPPISALAAWLPLVALLQLGLAFGLGLLLAALNVRRRDTAHAVGIALTAGMFVTPVFWVPSLEVLPDLAPWLPWIESNPFHKLLYAFRATLMGGEPTATFARPVVHVVGWLALWSVAFLASGLVWFGSQVRHFADEV